MNAHAVFDRAALLAAATRAYSVVENKSPMPILSMFRLTAAAGGDSAKLEATNLIVAILEQVVVAEAHDAFDLLVPASKFVATLRAFSGDKVTLELVEESKLRMTCGKSKIHVATLPSDDFPILFDTKAGAGKEPRSIYLPRDVLVAGLRHGSICMYPDDSRPHMHGAQVEVFGSTLRVLATDGHRLARCDVVCADAAKVKGEAASFLLPKRCVEELSRFAQRAASESVAIEIGDRYVVASYVGDDDCEHNLWLRRTSEDVRFPPWEKVLRPLESQLLVDVDEALSALGVAVVANGKNKHAALLLELGDVAESGVVLRFSATSEDGDASATSEVVVAANDACLELPDRKWCFDAAYIDDALCSLRDADSRAAHVSVGDPRDAITLSTKTPSRDKKLVVVIDHVIMPMRM